MANYQIIKRLEMEIRLIMDHPNCSKTKLLARLETEHGLSTTARTLERDLRALDLDFGIEVHYDRCKNGYYINDDNHREVLNFLQFAGRIYLGDLLREGLKNFESLKAWVKLEDYTGFDGIDHVRPILMAIKNGAEIGFVHENFQKQTRTDYKITPLQLREYQGRWYVVGVPRGDGHIKTFGLARLSKLKTLGLSAVKAEQHAEQLKKFDRIIGLNYNAAEKPETIELAVSAHQFKYLDTLPLHPSQEALDEKLLNGWRKLRLFLIPNYELKMQLLKLGDQIEVLGPESLREEIEGTLSRTLNLYEDGNEN